tara:strand:+ start:214 stop:549 length:336 start_codon:yes stop_codon:yes gene_type:complete
LEGQTGFLAVIVAAITGFAFGTSWYMTLSKSWMEVIRINAIPDGRPDGDSPITYAMAAIALILIAGMMRHNFVLSSIDTLGRDWCLASESAFFSSALGSWSTMGMAAARPS